MSPPGSSTPVFATTRWTLVLRARGDSPEARRALAELCEAYWSPVFRFLRSEGRTEDMARDLAQEFFARLLARAGVEGADPDRGRFRSYLLGAVKHFLADLREREGRLKRGGGAIHESLDTGPGATGSRETELVRQIPDPRAAPSDAVFDRAWALAVMDRALHEVEVELAATGRERQFAVLKGWLAGESAGRTQADAARELGMSEGAVKVAIHRLRRRFGELIRLELLHTLPEGADPEEELRYLVEVLG